MNEKRSEDIGELKIFNLNDKIQQYRNQWLLHKEQMELRLLPRQTCEHRPRGRNELKG